MEVPMNSKANPRDIAEEAVGQRLGSEPPEAVRERERMSVEETVERLAKSSGPQASIPVKTAESVGERVGDAYADPGSVARRTPHRSRREAAQILSHQFEQQPITAVMAGFILGYVTALLLHGRR
jgi:hypothetical protein